MKTELLNQRQLLMRCSWMLVVSLIGLNLALAEPAKGQAWEWAFVTIKVQDASLVEIFQEIEQQTDFVFMYGERVVQHRASYALNYKKAALKTVLEDLAQQASMKLNLVDQTIVVKLKPKPVPNQIIVEVPLSVISGKVTEASSGKPLVGATIKVKGSNVGTFTDEQGAYQLEVPSKAEVLEISFLGYETMEIMINGRTQIDVNLTVNYSDLDEVVVIGYGTQKKINLTGAVALIDGEQFESRPITQTSQALHGLSPGVFINTNSGEPGNDQASIIIRGIGTLNNSNPLILIDGIEAPINSVNPNDIESINVLKDAASASIYGSRAANGVILITTKNGSFNQKTTISYNGYAGVSNPTVLPDIVWDNRDYMELYREAAINSGRNFGFDDEDIARYDALPSTNWMEQMTRKNAPITSHNLSFQGGTDRVSYYFSNGFLYQQGFLAGENEYARFSSRLNLRAKLTDQLRFGTSIAYFNENGFLTPKDGTGRSFSDKGSLIFSGAMIQHPVSPVYDQFGRYGSLEADLGIERNRPSGQGVADNETVGLQGNDLLGNAYLEYEPINNLVFRGTVGINYQDEAITDIKKEYITYDPVTGEPWTNGNGTRNRGSILVSNNDKSINVTTWLQGSYNFELGKHGFGVLAGFNREKADLSTVRVDERQFGTKDVISLGQGTEIRTAGGLSEWGLVSFFGRVNYDYADRYLLEFNLRRDASSRFGANNRWATFPAFSGGWVLSNEDFWTLKAISFMKLRASWGKLGNQSTNLYPFASQVGLGQDYNTTSGAALVRLGNPDLRWEETTTTDIGLEIGLFDGRIRLEADYFLKQTEDILTDLPNPLTSGISASTTVNAASMENEGWEGLLKYRDDFGPVRLEIGLNVTHVKNVVTAINPDLADEEDRVRLNRSDNVWIIRGEPIYSIFGHQVAGIFQTEEEIAAAPDHSFIGNPAPGDFRYTDTDGDGAITAADQVVIGNRQPEWLYGANFRVEFKGLSFSGLVQGIGPADIYTARMYGPFPFAGVRTFWLDNRWTPENPSETVPRVWVDRRGYNGVSIETGDKQNSFWVQNRAYLRLKNVQLAYTFPQTLLERLPFSDLSIYLNGQNLWTMTDLLDLDPERFSRESHATNVVPQSKIVSVGLNATF